MRVSRPNRRIQLALWIDRWVGPPLCALLLAARTLWRHRPPAPAEPRRILVLKMWGMGSIALASPLLARLREGHPGARIDFLSLRENEPILRLYPQIDRTHSVDLSRGIAHFLFDATRTILRLRRERYDLVLDLEFFTRFSAIFAFLVAPGRSRGFSAKGKWRGRLHDVEVPFNAYHHVAANFLTLLRVDPMDPIDETLVNSPDFLPRLRPRPEDARACARILSADPAWREGAPLVVVNPNAGDMALERRWPLERVSELLRHLCARGTVNAVTIGSPAERDYVDSVVRASGAGARIANLAGKLSLGELVALLARADAVVSNDSGPVHLAAAAGASTVALFGPETPRLYAPLRSRREQRHTVHYLGLACSPCMFVHDNKVLSCWFAQARCMTGIQPAQVLASVDALLDPAGAALRVIP